MRLRVTEARAEKDIVLTVIVFETDYDSLPEKQTPSISPLSLALYKFLIIINNIAYQRPMHVHRTQRNASTQKIKNR